MQRKTSGRSSPNKSFRRLLIRSSRTKTLVCCICSPRRKRTSSASSSTCSIPYPALTQINQPLDTLTAEFLNFIQNSINQLNTKPDEDEKDAECAQIDEIMKVKKDILRICETSFKKNKAIINSSRLELQRAFAKVDEYPRKLAIYIDAFILKNGKDLDNLDVTNQINDLFDMVSLTTERDKFLYYYEQALSKSR